MVEALVRVVVGVLGLAVVAATVLSAVVTTILPRARATVLSRLTFLGVRRVFVLAMGRAPSYERRDRVFALYGPLSLLVLLQVWLLLIFSGFSLVHWAVTDGFGGWRKAVSTSGSSLFTLGTSAPRGAPETAVSYGEASVGLLISALLISFLPAIYGAFSRRESLVSKLEVRAGGPPSGTTMLVRGFRLQRLDVMDSTWAEFETWFAELEETHSSFPSLAFFRSPSPEKHWVTAAGAALDGAALRVACIDMENSVEAQLCIRAGFLALRTVARFFDVPFSEDPGPDDPITISRDEYDEQIAVLEATGIPVKVDREQAWRDFKGWRVNYDVPLVALAALTQAPFALWSSDRSLASTRRTPSLRSALRRGP